MIQRNRFSRTIETLESRNLLAVDCLPCDDNMAQMSSASTVQTASLEAAFDFSSRLGLNDNSLQSANNLGSLNGDRSVSGSIGGFDSLDFFRVNVTDDGQIDLRLTNRGVNTRLSLFDQRGNLVQNSTGSSNLQVSANVDAGVYFVGIGNWNFFSSNYQLDLSTDPVRESISDATGNSIENARNIGPIDGTRRFNESVGRGDPADVYRFDVNRTSSIDISLTQLSADVDVYLLDSRGRVLASSDRPGSSSESIRGTLQEGSYFVSVAPYQNNASDYRFSITATPQHSTQPPNVTQPPAATQPQPDTQEPDPPQNSEPRQPLENVTNYGGVNDWNLNSVNAPESWAAGFTGQGTIVAVVDTGVDLQHYDIGENLWVNIDDIPGDGIDNDRNGYVDDVYGWNFVNNNNNPDDENGHGTHVAGTIAAERNGSGATGIAYDAQIMPVKVLGDNGSGSDYSVALGIRYAVDNDADIINLSLGGIGNSGTIRSALEYALQNDVFVVIAAGNEGASQPSYPAIHSRDLSNVISVGAATQQGTKASFSNRVGASRAIQVDAPGVGIYSTLPNDRFGRLSGTSMAAPHVAGLAALALSAQPNLTAADLKNLISEGADQGVSGSDSSGGINAATSVAFARSAASFSAAQTSESNSLRSGYVFRTVDIQVPIVDASIAAAITDNGTSKVRNNLKTTDVVFLQVVEETIRAKRLDFSIERSDFDRDSQLSRVKAFDNFFAEVTDELEFA